MKLLALDTTAEGCSAALWHDGTLYEQSTLAPRGHTRYLLPMVKELVAESGIPLSDLDAVAFGRGPGSFTGLRIATGVVQGLAYGLDIPVVPVSSLAAVAMQAVRLGYADAEAQGIAVAFDARMGEVYWGCFVSQEGTVVALGDECVTAPGSVVLPASAADHWICAGAGWHLGAQMPESVSSVIKSSFPELYPLASDVAILGAAAWQRGEQVSAADAAPVYVRNEITWKKLPGR